MTESNRQTSKIEINLACSEMLKDALPILQALLASGHFTYPFEDGNQPGCYTSSNGPDWNEKDSDGIKWRASPRTSVAVTYAIELAHELRTEIEHLVNLRQQIDDLI
jgi:hypothetical protein